MAEIKQQYVFSHKEVTEALIKKQDIHEGLWAIYVEFGITGTNIQNLDGAFPAAIVPVLKIGLQRSETTNPLTVDAAEVNPMRKRRGND